MRMLRRGYKMLEPGFDRVSNLKLATGVTEWPGYEFSAEMRKARRFLPGIHPTLGFFVAKLQKPGHSDAAASKSTPRPAPAPEPAPAPRRTAAARSARPASAPPAASGKESSGLREAAINDDTAVLGFFEAMEKHLSIGVMGRHRIAVREQDGVRMAVATSNEVLGLPPELLHDADAGGLVLGTLEGGRFHLDLQGAVLAARHTKAQTLRVTEQSTKVVLYGRNVLGASIVWHDRALSRGDACIICDGRGQALAIGVVTGSMSGQGPAVRPVLDLGTYLRDQDTEDDLEE
jgi:ribosome biogenesis protein Nip4